MNETLDNKPNVGESTDSSLATLAKAAMLEALEATTPAARLEAAKEACALVDKLAEHLDALTRQTSDARRAARHDEDTARGPNALTLAHYAVIGAAKVVVSHLSRLDGPPATYDYKAKRIVPDREASASLRSLLAEFGAARSLLAEFGAALDAWERAMP